MTCYISSSIAAPCQPSMDQDHVNNGPVHVVQDGRLRFFCAEHCPVCHPKLKDWTEPAKTIAGEQEGLF